MHETIVHPHRNNPGLHASIAQVSLKNSIFEEISRIVYNACGIKLVTGKEELVRSRLFKRLRTLGLKDFDAYMQYIQEKKNGAELKIMIESLTTNKTSFFRENPHFEFMKKYILPDLIAREEGIRVWSAGCSSGEEPYSIAIILNEEWPQMYRRDLRILATDISSPILEKARKGEYEKELLLGIPPILRDKYFTQDSSLSAPTFRIKDVIKRMVRFANLNLMASWPMQGRFDLIFCRNVMIYFDQPTQQELVRRFYEILAPGGYLMVGHSESLIASYGDFKYVKPATYRKKWSVCRR